MNKITSKDLEKLISLKLSDDEFIKYLTSQGKISYIEQMNNPMYNNGMSNYNETDEQEYIKTYISENYLKNKEFFYELTFNEISLYNNITFQLVTDNIHLNWDFVCISGHKNITYDIIKNNNNIPWNYEGILSNKNINFDELVEYVISTNRLDKNNWVNEIKELEKGKYLNNESPTLRTLMMNKGVTENDIRKYKEIEWNYNLLSSNCNISWEFVLENIDYKWNFAMLFSRPTNTWEKIKEMGKLISEDFDEKNILDNFDERTIQFISSNPNITWNIINANLHESWNWCMVTINPNITMKIINDNPDKPWNKCNIYKNNSITLEELNNNNIVISELETYEKIFGFSGDCFDF
jgi:hypothetical protein